MPLPKLIVVLGTTACGKSGLGVELARRFDGEIVSADSRQVYRGLDLGTGKVTQAERMGVAHHMLDVVDPNQSYSVADFQRGAYDAIDAIRARGRTPFLVGGTGLYVRAVTEGFTFADARPDPALRAQLERRTTAELYALYQARAGKTLAGGEEKNRHRLLRALEKLSAGAVETPPCPRYDCLLLGMTFPREVLCRRIDERLQRRIDDGMIEEVANLRANGARDLFLEGLGLEYRYILWYLTGRIPTLDALQDELGRAIKRFAKRQMVWFKKDRDVLWLDTAVDPLPQAVAATAEFLGRPSQF
ncbi:MAG: tRNA (adenosine(37)-N6)-dimethylallyltransferase MiaA [Clostridiales bacterium]|nr:tRNA (adenosine(37)-N6)-dimethylallyltransferase MiaA [Flavonifractor sp.]MDU2195364.1 tRNA (adenosine(37)-N6)-dimethylallyltransferase MiaA [Clostridiales bacterium]